MGRPARVHRDQVLQAAREAFAARGYEGTTLADIGARVGLSPAALLRHAPNKEALFAQAMYEGSVVRALPTDFLARVPPGRDPAGTLRRLARELIPFVEAKMGENIARWTRARSAEEAGTIRLPFDPREKDSPSARVLLALEGYLRRARAAGVVRLRDPRAAALAFVGSLQSYVFMHRVLRIEPPVPLPRYLDTLLDLWRNGALRPAVARRKP